MVSIVDLAGLLQQECASVSRQVKHMVGQDWAQHLQGGHLSQEVRNVHNLIMTDV